MNLRTLALAGLMALPVSSSFASVNNCADVMERGSRNILYSGESATVLDQLNLYVKMIQLSSKPAIIVLKSGQTIALHPRSEANSSWANEIFPAYRRVETSMLGYPKIRVFDKSETLLATYVASDSAMPNAQKTIVVRFDLKTGKAQLIHSEVNIGSTPAKVLHSSNDSLFLVERPHGVSAVYSVVNGKSELIGQIQTEAPAVAIKSAKGNFVEVELANGQSEFLLIK